MIGLAKNASLLRFKTNAVCNFSGVHLIYFLHSYDMRDIAGRSNTFTNFQNSQTVMDYWVPPYSLDV